MQTKKVCKDFEIKNLGAYYLHLKSDTLFLTNVSENFRKMCIATCHLDPAKFRATPGLAWQAALKRLK